MTHGILSSTGTLHLRQKLSTPMVRQPFLGSPPAVVSLTGFGTGAGAGIDNDGADPDQSQGLVMIRCGLTPAASGTLVLRFPVNTAVNYWLAGEWMNAVSVQAMVANVMTLNWTAGRTLISNEVLQLAYQWNVST